MFLTYQFFTKKALKCSGELMWSVLSLQILRGFFTFSVRNFLVRQYLKGFRTFYVNALITLRIRKKSLFKKTREFYRFTLRPPLKNQKCYQKNLPKNEDPLRHVDRMTIRSGFLVMLRFRTSSFHIMRIFWRLLVKLGR